MQIVLAINPPQYSCEVDGKPVPLPDCDDPASFFEAVEDLVKQQLGDQWDPDNDEAGGEESQGGEGPEPGKPDGSMAHGAEQSGPEIPTIADMWKQESEARMRKRVAIADMMGA